MKHKPTPDPSSTTFDEIIIDPLTRKAMSSILLECVDPILLKLNTVMRPIISEFIISERKLLVTGLELVSPKTAAIMTNIPIATIYRWIAANVIEIYPVDNKNVVSITQIKEIMRVRRAKLDF